jgi:hypothetical protein
MVRVVLNTPSAQQDRAAGQPIESKGIEGRNQRSGKCEIFPLRMQTSRNANLRHGGGQSNGRESLGQRDLRAGEAGIRGSQCVRVTTTFAVAREKLAP